MRKSGRFHAPALVLSAKKTMIGSDGRSTIVISAIPGPIPRTLPENASFSRSCPAPYSFSSFATRVQISNTSQASRWTSWLSIPRRWVISNPRSSPHAVTWKSINVPRRRAISSCRPASSFNAGWIAECPTNPPTSALMQLIVSSAAIAIPPSSLASGAWHRAVPSGEKKHAPLRPLPHTTRTPTRVERYCTCAQTPSSAAHQTRTDCSVQGVVYPI
jgi:hypothetical protein